MTFETTIKKKIQTSVENAFKAFANASIWSQWFSSDTVIDLRKGGRFTNSDGDTGEYLDIVVNRLLKFTWEGSFAGSQVELHFLPVGDATEVTLRHSKLAAQTDADKMKTCWTWTLDNLASFLENGQVITYSAWKTTQAEVQL